jgi:paraquat-inducible protein B
MSARANPAVIGAFVLGACIVLVAGLVLWGGTAMFTPRLRYVMFFENAVTGLQKGAPVQLRGVRVGQVTDVQVRWGTSLIAVYAELEPDLLKGVPQGGVDPAIRAAIRDRALRAQLRMQSVVTGVLYIALDDFPGTPIVLRGLDKAAPELPTVPTTIEVWTAKLEKIADSLAALPLDELARSMISTIDEARRILKSPEVARSLKSLDVALAESRDLVRHADGLVTNVNAQVGPLGSEARATLKSAQAALAQVPALVEDVRRVVAKVDAHADPLLTSLQKTSDAAGVTLERAQVTLTGVDGALNQDSPLGYELIKTLREVGELSRSLGSLADYLERNPNAVIYGARRPVVKEGR